MIAPPEKRPPRIVGLAIVIALVASFGTTLMTVRAGREQRDARLLGQHVAQLERELEELRARLGVGTGGTALDRIAQAVAKLRSLAFKQQVVAEVLSNDALKKRVGDQITKDNPRAEIDRNAKVLRALGLLDGDDNLYQILLDVQTEQVGGFYEPKSKKMVIGGGSGNLTALQRVLLAHEYLHALTDQHFGLDRLDKLQRVEKEDEAMAYLALIEGDATLLMGEYAQKGLTSEEQAALSREVQGISSKKLDAAPKVLRTALLFPYEEGARFARKVFERGGNPALDEAYRNPPVSTEQILHPERYIERRDDPVRVRMPDVADAMGEGWTSLESGAIGELDVRLVLNQFLPKNDANEAAAGWDGGLYTAVEGGPGVLVAALTAWDSLGEAAEALEAFERWLPERFGGRGGEKRVEGLTGRAWEGPDGAAEVVRAGTKVLLIVGPDLALVERARAAFGGDLSGGTTA